MNCDDTVDGDTDGEDLSDEYNMALSRNVPNRPSAHEVLMYLASHGLTDSYNNITTALRIFSPFSGTVGNSLLPVMSLVFQA